MKQEYIDAPIRLFAHEIARHHFAALPRFLPRHVSLFQKGDDSVSQDLIWVWIHFTLFPAGPVTSRRLWVSSLSPEAVPAILFWRKCD